MVQVQVNGRWIYEPVLNQQADIIKELRSEVENLNRILALKESTVQRLVRDLRKERMLKKRG